MGKGLFEKRIRAVMYREYSSLPGAEPEEVLFIIDEARKEMPLEMFDYKQPRKWNLLEYQQYYDALAHQVLELLLWFEKWFGSDENEEVKKENE